MSWADHHKESERLAANAESVFRAGDLALAQRLYMEAAQEEIKAFNAVDPTKKRTIGITAVSAAALLYKASAYEHAAQFVHRQLGEGRLAPFATEQLQSLLQSIWSDQARQQAGTRFSGGEVLVSVKGGRIVPGGAPLNLIIGKVEAIQTLFYRTTEFLRDMPHRKRGPAPIEIQQQCVPWLFQMPPGSYQFAVAIEEPPQQEIFKVAGPSGRMITDTFLKILRASADDPDAALVGLVPDPEYRGTFMRLTRNLMPTGDSFSQLDIRATTESKPVILIPKSRQIINDAIKRQFPKPPSSEHVEIVRLEGILRGLQLDDDWLEISVKDERVKIYGVSDTVDDVVGPMVNKQVTVEAHKKDGGHYQFHDIQPFE